MRTLARARRLPHLSNCFFANHVFDSSPPLKKKPRSQVTFVRMTAFVAGVMTLKMESSRWQLLLPNYEHMLNTYSTLLIFVSILKSTHQSFFGDK